MFNHFLFTFKGFSSQNYIGSIIGVGMGLVWWWWGAWWCRVFGCGNGHRARSNVQRAKNWRTVDQTLAYAGLKSDSRGKMRHSSFIIGYICPAPSNLLCNKGERVSPYYPRQFLAPFMGDSASYCCQNQSNNCQFSSQIRCKYVYCGRIVYRI